LEFPVYQFAPVLFTIISLPIGVLQSSQNINIRGAFFSFYIQERVILSDHMAVTLMVRQSANE
jgi:hypothetical protein